MTNSMGNLFEGLESELLKEARSMTPEQRAEEDRLKKIKWDYEALHTAFETDEDRADPERYPPEEEE